MFTNYDVINKTTKLLGGIRMFNIIRVIMALALIAVGIHAMVVGEPVDANSYGVAVIGLAVIYIISFMPDKYTDRG